MRTGVADNRPCTFLGSTMSQALGLTVLHVNITWVSGLAELGLHGPDIVAAADADRSCRPSR